MICHRISLSLVFGNPLDLRGKIVITCVVCQAIAVSGQYDDGIVVANDLSATRDTECLDLSLCQAITTICEA